MRVPCCLSPPPHTVQPDHKNSPHYRLEIKCEGRERERDWTDCLGKYFLDKRYSIVYCLVVVEGHHLVLRIYCYLEHNFTRCFTTALGIFTLGRNLIVILMFTKVDLILSILSYQRRISTGNETNIQNVSFFINVLTILTGRT